MGDFVVDNPLNYRVGNSHQPFLADMDPRITPPGIMGGQKFGLLPGHHPKDFYFTPAKLLILVHILPNHQVQSRQRSGKRGSFQDLISPATNLGQKALLHHFGTYDLDTLAHIIPWPYFSKAYPLETK
jgi:hypothetical protein